MAAYIGIAHTNPADSRQRAGWTGGHVSDVKVYRDGKPVDFELIDTKQKVVSIRAPLQPWLWYRWVRGKAASLNEAPKANEHIVVFYEVNNG
jgi:hypothetical protein